MCFKAIKFGAMAVGGLAILGGLVFGTDLGSYVTSSANSVRTAVKDAVPMEFELRRARDMIDDILPELHANIRQIAQEEVEIAALKADIELCTASLGGERTKVKRLRTALGTQQVSFTFGNFQYDRGQLKEELSRRFDRIKEAELVLASKDKLLKHRSRSLMAAMEMLEKTRAEKVRLEDQIASLDAQYRLVQAAAVGSKLQVDGSKLARTRKLIGDIKKRLDVAERVLAHEVRFTEEISVDGIDEADLLSDVDEYLGAEKQTASASNGTPALELSRIN